MCVLRGECACVELYCVISKKVGGSLLQLIFDTSIQLDPYSSGSYPRAALSSPCPLIYFVILSTGGLFLFSSSTSYLLARCLILL